MDVVILRSDTIDELMERTGRTREKLVDELVDSLYKGTQVYYYFDLPDLDSQEKHNP
jgi:hypothetical protein